MTPQEIFDTVARHLLKQAKAAVGNGGVHCFYRNGEGLSCAAGCLIPDDMYNENMEGESVGSLILEIKSGHANYMLPVFFFENEELIGDLQNAHDVTLRDYGVDPWKKVMLEIAKSWNLDPSVISGE